MIIVFELPLFDKNQAAELLQELNKHFKAEKINIDNADPTAVLRVVNITVSEAVLITFLADKGIAVKSLQ